jgi:hypothetical protein
MVACFRAVVFPDLDRSMLVVWGLSVEVAFDPQSGPASVVVEGLVLRPRALAASALGEAGRVFFPSGAAPVSVEVVVRVFFRAVVGRPYLVAAV